MIKISTKNGVRYSVPSYIDIKHLDKTVLIRFRVADVYKNKNLVVFKDDEEIKRVKKKVMAPGEMEQIILTKKDLDGAKEITLSLED